MADVPEHLDPEHIIELMDGGYESRAATRIRELATYVEGQPEPRKEWTVLYSPGWPGGIHPTPNTREKGEEHVREHGGRLFWRWTCAWQEIEVEPDG